MKSRKWRCDISGNKIGGKKIRETLIARLGGEEQYKEFIRERGRRGGLAPKTTPSGFAANRELASEAGRRGGKVSRRRKTQ